MKPLLLGAGAGVLAALALVPATQHALATLAQARAAHAELRAQAAGGQGATPLLAPGLSLRAGDAAAARGAMLARVQALSKAGGILVEETGAAPAHAGTAALRLRVSGAEKAVLAFADALERSRPLMRLRSWRVEAIEGGSIRMAGELVAAWQ